MGQLFQAPRDEPVTPEKAGTVELYRSQHQSVSVL